MTQNISFTNLFLEVYKKVDNTVRKTLNLEELLTDLNTEIQNLQLFDGTLPSLQYAKENGYEVGVISNIAVPYAQKVKEILKDSITTFTFSCEEGLLKPNPEILERAEHKSMVTPTDSVLYYGNSLTSDIHMVKKNQKAFPNWHAIHTKNGITR